MIKKIAYIFIILCFLKTSSLSAFDSSSYLVSKMAFTLNDFETVSKKIEINNKLNLSDFRDQMISSIILGDFHIGNELSLRILNIDEGDQEALMVHFSFLLLNNLNIDKISYKIKNNQNSLINFIFFNGKKIKTYQEISNSLIEILQLNYYDFANSGNLNYNFILFYLSLSTYFDTENDQALFLKAQTYQMMKNYNQAIYFYKKIGTDSSFFNDSQYYIAHNYEKSLSFSEAEKKIKQIIKSSENNFSLLKILADFYRINKNYELAIKYYTKIIDRENENLWYFLYLRGICYERKNDWVLAEKDFLQSIKIKDDSADVLNYLAYGWIEKNQNIEKSLAMLIKANELDPTSYYILDSLAWAYFKTNKLTLAAELMEEVIEMEPGEAISLDHLGDIYYALDRKREASFLWKQAKDLADPDDNIIESINKKLENYYAG